MDGTVTISVEDFLKLKYDADKLNRLMPYIEEFIKNVKIEQEGDKYTAIITKEQMILTLSLVFGFIKVSEVIIEQQERS